jgi:hypothetical protein
MDTPSSRLCSMKRRSFDEHKIIYYWVTCFCTIGIFFLGLYTMCFIRSATFKNYHIKLKISGTKLLAKLICLPMIFMVVNFAFFYRLLNINECSPVLNYSTLVAGHLMGALLAIGVWCTNSFVRKRLNKNTFRASCYYFSFGCFKSNSSNSSSNCTIPADDKSCAPPILNVENTANDLSKSLLEDENNDDLGTQSVDFAVYLNHDESILPVTNISRTCRVTA